MLAIICGILLVLGIIMGLFGIAYIDGTAP